MDMFDRLMGELSGNGHTISLSCSGEMNHDKGCHSNPTSTCVLQVEDGGEDSRY